MAESSSSFIPKRSGTTNRPQPTRRGNFFVFSIISYALFVAAPLASGVVFIYDKYVQKQFAQTVINLDSAIKDFSEADMQRVTEFEERLVIANSLLDSHVSFGTLFAILEASTAVTVQFNNLEIARVDKDTIRASASMSSDAFDALLFQRAVYAKDQKFTEANLTDIKFAGAAQTEGGETSASKEVVETDKKLSLSADFVISADQIAYNPIITTSAETTETSAETDQTNIETDVVGDTGTTTNQTDI